MMAIGELAKMAREKRLTIIIQKDVWIDAEAD